LVGNLDASELLFLAFPSLKNALLVPIRSTKTSLIPNPKYSPFHSLGFAQFSILWVSFSCSFSRFLNQLSLDSSPSNTGLEVTPFKTKFIAEQELISSIQAFSLDQELITVLVQAVGNYAPNKEIVLLMKMEQQLEINLFQNLKIFPPGCHEQVSRRWEEFQPSLETHIR
jgi:hypothetical protein